MQTFRTCPGLPSVVHQDWKQFRGIKSLFHFTGCSPLIQEGQSRNSRQELEAETTARCLLADHLAYACSAKFLKQPRFTCLRMVLPTVNWALLHRIAINMSPQTCPQANADGGNSSGKVSLFPGVSHIGKEINYHRIHPNHLLHLKVTAVRKIKWYI